MLCTNTTTQGKSSKYYACYSGVVVTGPGIYVACPVVDMDMFHASRSCSRQRYGSGAGLAHMLHLTIVSDTYKFLTVLVEDIGVALQEVQYRAFTDLGHDVIEWDVDTAGLDKLVEVSHDEDIYVRV